MTVAASSGRVLRAEGATSIAPAGEQGSVTIWLLGLCVAVLFLGGLSLDLWRGFSERRALAGVADAAVVAAASAVDEAHFRATGEVRLDAEAARRQVARVLAAQGDLPTLERLTPVVDAQRAMVIVEGRVPLTLLRVLLPDQPSLPIRVESAAEPRIR